MRKKRTKFIIIIAIIITVLIIPIFFVQKNQKLKYEIFNEPYIKLYLSQEDKTIELLLENYIVGTVAAEMPASFEMEALKAQAVCARTYAFRKLLENKRYPREANLSDDINSCQAFISQKEFNQRHPGYKDLYKKVREAVRETRGEIMIYDNQPIDSLYHSTCGGQTEGAFSVGGTDVPYLQSVKCRYCKQSRHYESVQVFSVQDFAASLGLNNSQPQVQVSENTSSGRIKKVKINDKELSGEKLRHILGLPSTWCDFKVNAGQVKIESRGYGHGLGLCQYGANGMALEGKTYHQILKHYYKDIEFSQLKY